MLSGETSSKTPIRCAIYTRKSTEEGLEQEFNSLDAQRECAEAYILSQRQEGWTLVSQRYDDGGFTGANLERPALRQLTADIQAGRVDCVLVYKVDRLSRSLLDFARLMEVFDKRGVTFVSVTQQINSHSPIGRLTLNVLLSFAQFEREIISERTRDKQSAARRKGKWTGGFPVLGYDPDPRTCRLVVNETEAEQVKKIFANLPSPRFAGGHVRGHPAAGLDAEELDDPEGQTTRGETLRPSSAGTAADQRALHRRGEPQRKGLCG